MWVIFIFILILIEFSASLIKTRRSVASGLGLHCLHMSNNRTLGLYGLKNEVRKYRFEHEIILSNESERSLNKKNNCALSLANLIQLCTFLENKATQFSACIRANRRLLGLNPFVFCFCFLLFFFFLFFFLFFWGGGVFVVVSR